MLPYQVAFRQTLDPIVMLSTAVYPALDCRAAAWSRPIIHGAAARPLGFTGVTITDSLDSAAAVRHLTDPVSRCEAPRRAPTCSWSPARRPTSKGVYCTACWPRRGAGTLPRSRLTASYNRILTLKGRL